ncbi:MAG: hypothetical protein RLZZ338_3505, partial [Cyanobacteriota bacterium]
ILAWAIVPPHPPPVSLHPPLVTAPCYAVGHLCQVFPTNLSEKHKFVTPQIL